MSESNVHFGDKEELEKKIAQIKRDGFEKLFVLADFDRTLTKAHVNNSETATTWAQVRKSKLLSQDYAKCADSLFEIYRPIELSDEIPLEEKVKKMDEWWLKHLELLVKFNFSKDIIGQIIKDKQIQLREGAFRLLDLLNQKGVPLLIFSAGIGDMISSFLLYENVLHENTRIISNFFNFDKEGIAVNFKHKIFHSLDKSGKYINGYPEYKPVENRRNILLLGDLIEDAKMVEGLNVNCVIKIGFLNKETASSLDKFLNHFDVVITNDGSMDYVNELLEQVF